MSVLGKRFEMYFIQFLSYILYFLQTEFGSKQAILAQIEMIVNFLCYHEYAKCFDDEILPV